MKNKLLIRINNLLEIEEYYKEGITNFLFPLSCYSIGYNTFNLDEIKSIKDKYNINVYLLVNRVLDNKDCNTFKLIIPKLSFVNGIIYEDIAIYQMLKNTNINLIWNQAHFAVNYHSINYWLSKDNIISCMLANELEKSELKSGSLPQKSGKLPFLLTHLNKITMIISLWNGCKAGQPSDRRYR